VNKCLKLEIEMHRTKFDAIDLKIMAQLQKNGRITNVDLSSEVGISAPPCLRRVRTLEEQDIIQSYHAQINEAALGFPMTIFLFIRLSTQKEADLQCFEEKVLTWPYVRDCFMLSGDTDFVLRCVAPDWKLFQEFLNSSVTCFPHIASVKTSIMLRQSKRAVGIPFELIKPSSDTLGESS
jgi:DNA-binding Lrp family transcriptional regulator